MKSKSCKNISSHCKPKTANVKKANTKEVKDVRKVNKNQAFKKDLVTKCNNTHVIAIDIKGKNYTVKRIKKEDALKKLSFLDKFINWLRGY